MAERIQNPLAHDALRNFRIIYGAVRLHFRKVEKACGISGSQLWILNEVESTPGIGVSELAKRLSIHQSTCSQLVEKLVTAGLLSKTRTKEDQRRVGLSSSELGREVMARAPPPMQGVFPDALMAMKEKDLTELNRALLKVLEQLHLHDEAFAGKPLSDL